MEWACRAYGCQLQSRWSNLLCWDGWYHSNAMALTHFVGIDFLFYCRELLLVTFFHSAWDEQSSADWYARWTTRRCSPWYSTGERRESRWEPDNGRRRWLQLSVHGYWWCHAAIRVLTTQWSWYNVTYGESWERKLQSVQSILLQHHPILFLLL